MKRILLVTRPIAPPWDEASKNFAFNLAKNINDERYQLHLLTNGKVDDLPDSIIQQQIYTHSQNDFGFSQKIRLFWFLFRKAHNFDALHLLFTPTKSNTDLIKFVLRVSATIHGKRVKTIQTVATLREDIFSDEEIKELMFSDMVVTYSDYAKNKLRSLGIKNTERIYPGIDLQLYSQREKNKILLEACNFKQEDFIIHFSGEYVRLGAIDDIIDSFIEISKKIPGSKLFLAVRVKNEKDAIKKKEIVSKLKGKNILEKVAFFNEGNFSMSDVYNLADISLFPVRNMFGKFDVPLVVIEAMACKKPVIISNIPILKEFTNDNTSVIIEGGNISDLTEKILLLHNDKLFRDSIGKNAREYVEANFDINNVAKQYDKIYENI